MRKVRNAVLYAALALGANLVPGQAAWSGAPNLAQVSALRQGDMRKLEFHTAPRPVPDIAFQDAAGAPHRLSDYRGRYLVVNFWATWCAPCRKEMPTLDRLQAQMGGAKLQVLPIATIRNRLPAIQRFYKEDGIKRLPILIDPKAELARRMGVMGLPVTVIVNPDGQEIARLIGEANWSGPDARAVLGALIGPGGDDAGDDAGDGAAAGDAD
ncbi:thioredoxin [Defluviimonas sp. 20V17]|uniref:Thioredoxin n=1 Tax=Allgaiera indica TaxID=765699 RepID=A0AAN4UTP8_9RHOB|nr:TlpA disulfide reductase family protein [Allgaiera indica]KDB05550.1 thioredoxin [Defluviimonas sp. 20V17]GHE03583.1 thioredoxin [Allgaiera indica]SDX44438.1 Thiol-disulfide isomerase or thioredoxin [Allgaiera indica]